ncbi:hemolymph juvenile hormone binding protein (JHBP) [Popillia japonica]|uniref:Hemolymph juvenile hormone binding protein (JHBP) n=1 Tax=Popillia japonica TaxID=7064 RepID=A0AAW1IC67_POPJA
MDGPLLKVKPKWLLTCERDDPQLNECLRNVLAKIFPQLAVGIPEINVEGFEPLYLDRMTLSKAAGPVTLTGSFSNITVVGPSNSTPTYTRINISDRKMDIGIYFPHLDIVSKYDLKGKILILPLVGDGDCKMTLGGVDTMITTNISFIVREGREVLQIRTMHTKYTMKSIKIHLSNLFNGNKLLGATVNRFLNDHGIEIVQELEETIGESLSEIFLDITNNLFWKLPTEFWLPDHTTKISKSEENRR